jgi:predicted nucleic acid-binding protein
MAAERLFTVEEFWAMPDEPGKRLELVRGEVREVRPVGAQQALMAGRIYRRLDDVAEVRDLGLVFTAGRLCLASRAR